MIKKEGGRVGGNDKEGKGVGRSYKRERKGKKFTFLLK